MLNNKFSFQAHFAGSKPATEFLQIKRIQTPFLMVFATHQVIQNRTNSNLNLFFTSTTHLEINSTTTSRSRFPRLRSGVREGPNLHDITVAWRSQQRKPISVRPYLEALPATGTPEIPIRPSFSNGWFLEVWWISSFAYFLCKDEKSSSKWLEQPFIHRWLRGFQVVLLNWCSFVIISTTKRYSMFVKMVVKMVVKSFLLGLAGLVFGMKSSHAPTAWNP